MERQVETLDVNLSEPGLVNAEQAVSKLEPKVLYDFVEIFKKFQPNGTVEQNLEASVSFCKMKIYFEK